MTTSGLWVSEPERDAQGNYRPPARTGSCRSLLSSLRELSWSGRGSVPSVKACPSSARARAVLRTRGSNVAGYAHALTSLGRFALNGGIRMEDNEQYGNFVSFQVGSAVTVRPGHPDSVRCWARHQGAYLFGGVRDPVRPRESGARTRTVDVMGSRGSAGATGWGPDRGHMV